MPYMLKRLFELTAPETEEDTSASQEPQTSEETNQSQSGGRPEEGLEEMGGTGSSGRLENVSIAEFCVHVLLGLPRNRNDRSCPE